MSERPRSPPPALDGGGDGWAAPTRVLLPADPADPAASNRRFAELAAAAHRSGCALELAAPIRPGDAVSVRAHPRERPLGADPLAAIGDALDIQRRVVRGGDGGVPVPFFQFLEGGETVDYAVLNRDGSSALHRGPLPADVARAAQLIAIQNAGRARRPAATGSGRAAASNEPADSVLNPARVASEPAFASELWLPWRSPRDGTAWRLMFNPFPIWPPRAEPSAGFHEPLQMTVSREDLVHQREARDAAVIHDLLLLLAALNASPSFAARGERFRIGVNGWSYRPEGPKAGASQAQLHANLVRAHFPIESTAAQTATVVREVTRSSIDDAAVVLTSSGGDGFAALATETAAILAAITAQDQSFNLLLAPVAALGLRAFIFPRAVGIPEPLFANEWAFAELSRAPVIDDPRLFYALDPRQRRAADAAAKTGQLEAWVRAEKQAGRLTHHRPDLFADIWSALRVSTGLGRR